MLQKTFRFGKSTIFREIIEVIWSVAEQEKVHLIELEEFLQSVSLDISVVGVNSLVWCFSLSHVMERKLVVNTDPFQYFHAVSSHRVNSNETTDI